MPFAWKRFTDSQQKWKLSSFFCCFCSCVHGTRSFTWKLQVGDELPVLCPSPVKRLPKQLDDFFYGSLPSMFLFRQHSWCEMPVDWPSSAYLSVPWASAFGETDVKFWIPDWLVLVVSLRCKLFLKNASSHKSKLLFLHLDNKYEGQSKWMLGDLPASKQLFKCNLFVSFLLLLLLLLVLVF